jgi:hypothetical protein
MCQMAESIIEEKEQECGGWQGGPGAGAEQVRPGRSGERGPGSGSVSASTRRKRAQQKPVWLRSEPHQVRFRW